MHFFVFLFIPVYNVERYLAKCLDSVICQTLSDIEIICVEDKSTDNSRVILEEYRQKDPRIRIIWHEKNLGLLMARKSGVMAAQGQYIMFLDSDDKFFPHACETAFAAIEKHNTDAVEFGVRVIDDKDNVIKIVPLEAQNEERLEGHNLLCLWSQGKLKNWTIWNKIYKARLCRKSYNEIESAHITMAEDVYYACVFWYYAQSISMISEELYQYRWGNGISTQHLQGSISLSYFADLLGEKDSYDAIVRFIGTKPDKEDYQDYVKHIHELFLHFTISCWSGGLIKKYRGEGFLLFLRKWGEKHTAEALSWLFDSLNREKEELILEKEELIQDNQRIKAELETVRRLREDLEHDLYDIKNGWSFKLGRFITFIPRKIRELN